MPFCDTKNPQLGAGSVTPWWVFSQCARPWAPSQHSAEFQSSDWIQISLNLSLPEADSMMKLVCFPSRMFSARLRFIRVYLEMDVYKFSFRLSPPISFFSFVTE